VTLPLVFKEGNAQQHQDRSISDLSLDLTRKWGTVGNILTALTIVFQPGTPQ